MREYEHPMELDYQDAKALAAFLEQLENEHNIKVRRITFDVYGEHRVTASRRSTYQRLRVRKVNRVRS